jgi:hypothetical protein
MQWEIAPLILPRASHVRVWSARAVWAGYRRRSLQAARFLGLTFDLRRRAHMDDAAAAAPCGHLSGAAWQFQRFAVGLRHVAALAWRPLDLAT